MWTDILKKPEQIVTPVTDINIKKVPKKPKVAPPDVKELPDKERDCCADAFEDWGEYIKGIYEDDGDEDFEEWYPPYTDELRRKYRKIAEGKGNCQTLRMILTDPQVRKKQKGYAKILKKWDECEGRD
tara:strand:+ start:6950 stop:7333 length:384 start_codon:yes stop_codon:yes gene_type:complete